MYSPTLIHAWPQCDHSVSKRNCLYFTNIYHIQESLLKSSDFWNTAFLHLFFDIWVAVLYVHLGKFMAIIGSPTADDPHEVLLNRWSHAGSEECRALHWGCQGRGHHPAPDHWWWRSWSDALRPPLWRFWAQWASWQACLHGFWGQPSRPTLLQYSANLSPQGLWSVLRLYEEVR